MDFQSLLGAVRTILSTVKTAARLPGVNLIPYTDTVANAIEAIEFAYEKGVDVAVHIKDLTDTFSQGLPTQENLDAFNARMAKLRARIHAPLPPPEEGEPADDAEAKPA